jgi:hypothetical protein
MLELMALKFHGSIWASFTCYLRTRSRALPSERTVKEVLAQELLRDFHNIKPSAMMQEIHGLSHSSNKDDGQGDNSPRQKPHVA